jgi:hypothetical protein
VPNRISLPEQGGSKERCKSEIVRTIVPGDVPDLAHDPIINGIGAGFRLWAAQTLSEPVPEKLAAIVQRLENQKQKPTDSPSADENQPIGDEDLKGSLRDPN